MGFSTIHIILLQLSAHIAQSVEHFLGKEEVTGSNPVMGSTVSLRYRYIDEMRSPDYMYILTQGAPCDVQSKI